MKVFGIEEVDGGLMLVLPSGSQRMVALPANPKRAAELLGRRVLEAVADPAEPRASASAPQP